MADQVTTYITAGNIISSLGYTTEENISRIKEYVFPARKNVPTLEPKSEYSYLEQLLILCLQETIRKSGINPSDCGLVISTTKGNIDLLNQDKEEVYLPVMAERIARFFGTKNTPIVVSTACISGVSALIIASRLIRKERYKHILVAGGDLLTRFVETGFHSFKSISHVCCRPYDKERDGLSLGEACGSILVTNDRNYVKEKLPVIIENGYISNDANHISGPSRTGDGLWLAIKRTMEGVNILPGDISFINAHGTGTVYNDEMESKAFHLAGIDHLPVNSLKPYWGHTLGASGLIESIACMEQLQNGELFGTPGFKETDVTYPLQISPTHRSLSMQRCLKTASGFGGSNAAILFALEPYAQPLNEYPVRNTIIKHSCTIEENRIILDGNIVIETDKNDEFPRFIRSVYKQLSLDDRKFYKMDDLCKLGYIAASCIVQKADKNKFKPEETGVILANRSSSLDTDRKHQEIIDQAGDQEASPAVFVYTLPNVVIGEICIRYKIKGENTFFISSEYDEESLRKYVEIAMEEQRMKTCLYGWCELEGNKYKADLKWLEIDK